MLIPDGDYRYEILRGGELIAVEEESLRASAIRGIRRPAGGSSFYEVEAELDEAGLIRRVVARYNRGPFVRSATYESAGDFLRGSISAVGGRNDVTTKLGRFREIDADLVICRALTIAHIRERGASRWTGRAAIIDPNTLVAATHKQTCRRRSDDPHFWIYETRMGDSEEIEIDDEGRVLIRRDNRGTQTVLKPAGMR